MAQKRYLGRRAWFCVTTSNGGRPESPDDLPSDQEGSYATSVAHGDPQLPSMRDCQS